MKRDKSQLQYIFLPFVYKSSYLAKLTKKHMIWTAYLPCRISSTTSRGRWEIG